MATAERITSVPVRASTLRDLQPYRIGGKSYDEIILDLIETDPPESFWREVERRSNGPELTLEQMRERLRL